MARIVDHPKLIMWYAKNAILDHPKLVSIPVGFMVMYTSSPTHINFLSDFNKPFAILGTTCRKQVTKLGKAIQVPTNVFLNGHEV